MKTSFDYYIEEQARLFEPQPFQLLFDTFARVEEAHSRLRNIQHVQRILPPSAYEPGTEDRFEHSLAYVIHEPKKNMAEVQSAIAAICRHTRKGVFYKDRIAALELMFGGLPVFEGQNINQMKLSEFQHTYIPFQYFGGIQHPLRAKVKNVRERHQWLRLPDIKHMLAEHERYICDGRRESTQHAQDYKRFIVPGSYGSAQR